MEQLFFVSTYGRIPVCQIDMPSLRVRLAEWEKENEPPAPPLKEMTPTMFKFKESRRAAEVAKNRGIPMDQAEWVVAREIGTYQDKDDPDYIEELKLWEARRYIHAEDYVLANGVIFDTVDGEESTLNDLNGRKVSLDGTFGTLQNIVKSEERYRLYRFVVDNSELSWAMVVEEAEKLGIKRRGEPILKMIPEGGGEAQSLVGLGAMAARRIGVDPLDYAGMPVRKQAGILAVDMCERWSEYFAAQDHREKASANARSKGKR